MGVETIYVYFAALLKLQNIKGFKLSQTLKKRKEVGVPGNVVV